MSKFVFVFVDNTGCFRSKITSLKHDNNAGPRSSRLKVASEKLNNDLIWKCHIGGAIRKSNHFYEATKKKKINK